MAGNNLLFLGGRACKHETVTLVLGGSSSNRQTHPLNNRRISFMEHPQNLIFNSCLTTPAMFPLSCIFPFWFKLFSRFAVLSWGLFPSLLSTETNDFYLLLTLVSKTLVNTKRDTLSSSVFLFRKPILNSFNLLWQHAFFQAFLHL